MYESYYKQSKTMVAKKSFLEILIRALSTFKKSFWGLLITYLIIAFAIFISYFIIENVFHIPILDLKEYTNIKLTISSKILISIFLILGTYGAILLNIWQLLIIKNNMFDGASYLLQSLKSAFSKSLKICVIFALLITVISLWGILINPIPCNPLTFFIPLLYFPLSPLVIFLVGVIVQDYKIENAFGIFSINYLKILKFNIILSLLQFFILVIIVKLGFTFPWPRPIIVGLLMPAIFWAVSEPLLYPILTLTGILANMLTIFKIPIFFPLAIVISSPLYFLFVPFQLCFFLELYLDLAKKEDEDTDEQSSPQEPDPNIFDINKSDKQKLQQSQKVNEQKTPEGLHKIGENYNDKK